MSATKNLDDFAAEYGHVVTNAMEVYIRDMRKKGDDLLATYQEISADPERAAAQDKTLMTTDGLQMSAGALHQAADLTERALRAWEELTEDDDEDDER